MVWMSHFPDEKSLLDEVRVRGRPFLGDSRT